MFRNLALAAMSAGLSIGPGSAFAADLSPKISVPNVEHHVIQPHYVAPPQSYIRGLGRWHGHHDWDWSQDPHHFYATYGWKQPWSYAPRTLPYREYRPRVVMPTPVEPSLYRGTPEAWTAQWYEYCASRYRSFDPDTGYYTTYSGRRQVCK